MDDWTRARRFLLCAWGCRIYLASNRAGGPGGQDIYVAERPK